jgi:hypothetical protein
MHTEQLINPHVAYGPIYSKQGRIYDMRVKYMDG